MKTKIYDTDPYLMPYKGAIDARSERILDILRISLRFSEDFQSMSEDAVPIGRYQ